MAETTIEHRVRQLLALARNNPEPNEAALAFARAQDLATRHGLELDEIEGADEQSEQAPPPREVGEICDEPIDATEGRGKAVYWRVTIACAVARANGCRSYVKTGWRAGTWSIGTVADLATARYVTEMILREVDAMAVEAVKRYAARTDLDPRFDVSPRKYGSAWRTGCADAIAMRLRSQQKAIEAERKAIDERRTLALAAPTEAEQHAALATATTALVRVERAAEYLTRRDAAIEQHPEYRRIYLRNEGKKKKDGSDPAERRGGWGGSGGHGSRDGYASGRSHGSSMNVGGGSRRAIGGGK